MKVWEIQRLGVHAVELERENEQLKAERAGWTREWRSAVQSAWEPHLVDYTPWTADKAEAEADVKAELEYATAWLERRDVSPPERVSEEDR